MVHALWYIFNFLSLIIVFTSLYGITLSPEFVSLEDNLFCKIALEVLMDVSGDHARSRVNISSLSLKVFRGV